MDDIVKDLRNKILNYESQLTSIESEKTELKKIIELKENYVKTFSEERQRNHDLRIENQKLSTLNEELQCKLEDVSKDCKFCQELKEQKQELKGSNQKYLIELKINKLKISDLEKDLIEINKVNSKTKFENIKLSKQIDKYKELKPEKVEELSGIIGNLKRLLYIDSEQRKMEITKTCDNCRNTAHLICECFKGNESYRTVSMLSKKLLHAYNHAKLTLLRHIKNTLNANMLRRDEETDLLRSINEIIDESKKTSKKSGKRRKISESDNSSPSYGTESEDEKKMFAKVTSDDDTDKAETSTPLKRDNSTPSHYIINSNTQEVIEIITLKVPDECKSKYSTDVKEANSGKQIAPEVVDNNAGMIPLCGGVNGTINKLGINEYQSNNDQLPDKNTAFLDSNELSPASVNNKDEIPESTSGFEDISAPICIDHDLEIINEELLDPPIRNNANNLHVNWIKTEKFDVTPANSVTENVNLKSPSYLDQRNRIIDTTIPVFVESQAFVSSNNIDSLLKNSSTPYQRNLDNAGNDNRFSLEQFASICSRISETNDLSRISFKSTPEKNQSPNSSRDTSSRPRIRENAHSMAVISERDFKATESQPVKLFQEPVNNEDIQKSSAFKMAENLSNNNESDSNRRNQINPAEKIVCVTNPENRKNSLGNTEQYYNNKKIDPYSNNRISALKRKKNNSEEDLIIQSKQIKLNPVANYVSIDRSIGSSIAVDMDRSIGSSIAVDIDRSIEPRNMIAAHTRKYLMENMVSDAVLSKFETLISFNNGNQYLRRPNRIFCDAEKSELFDETNYKVELVRPAEKQIDCDSENSACVIDIKENLEKSHIDHDNSGNSEFVRVGSADGSQQNAGMTRNPCEDVGNCETGDVPSTNVTVEQPLTPLAAPDLPESGGNGEEQRASITEISAPAEPPKPASPQGNPGEIFHNLFQQLSKENENNFNNFIRQQIIITNEVTAKAFVDNFFNFFVSGQYRSFDRKLVNDAAVYVILSIIRQHLHIQNYYYNNLLAALRSAQTVDNNRGFTTILILSNINFFIFVQQWDQLVEFFIDLMRLPNIRLLHFITFLIPQVVFPRSITSNHSSIVNVLKFLVMYEYSTGKEYDSRKFFEKSSLEFQKFWLNGQTAQNFQPINDINRILQLIRRLIAEYESRKSAIKFHNLDKDVERKYFV